MPPAEGVPSLAVLWTNCGPYHLARLRALSAVFPVVAIEFAGTQTKYGWTPDKLLAGVEICTLRSGAWESQNQLAVALDVWLKLSHLKPGAVLVPGYATLPALAAALWSTTRGVPSALMSDSCAEDHTRNWLVEWLKQLIIRALFDRAIVSGKRARQYLKRLGMSESRIRVGYDVVDNELFFADPTCPREGFLYVGRLAPEKNLPLPLAAFGKYRSLGGAWSLTVVGDGPLAAEVAQQAGPGIDLVGRKSADDLRSYYAGSGCLILPSLSEPWGLVVNEAMASGLPVLVSKQCGCVDDLVVDGENGFTFEPNDEPRLTELLFRISSLPGECRSQMGKASQTVISGFSLTRWVDAVRDLVLNHNNIAKCPR